jgi:hypoxanthine phosphoribosyltransferase
VLDAVASAGVPSDGLTHRLPPELGAVVLDERQIARRVRDLGRQISQDYEGRDLLIVGILTGAFLFTCDLIRHVELRLMVDFMSISRYSRRPATGEVKILKDLQSDVSGRDVLLVEDIVDTGLTLHYLMRNLANRRPASLQICSLLDRPDLRLADIPIRYKGFVISSDFLVGYGLDFQGKYRNLPYLAAMKRVEDSESALSLARSRIAPDRAGKNQDL